MHMQVTKQILMSCKKSSVISSKYKTISSKYSQFSLSARVKFLENLMDTEIADTKSSLSLRRKWA